MNPVHFLAVLSLALTSCSALGLGPGLQAADTIVRGACGAILAADKPADVLASLASAQKDITTEIARTAAQNSDPAAVQAIVAKLGALQDAQRAHAEQLGRLAGAMAPPPCPVAAPGGSSPVQEGAP